MHGEREAEQKDAEHRGWSRKMILWSVALAAFLLIAAWGVTNWRRLHLGYCRNLLASSDVEEQLRGIRLIGKVHLRAGQTIDDIKPLFAPLVVEEHARVRDVFDDAVYYYCRVTPPGRGDGLVMLFRRDQKTLEMWWAT